jgi:nucleoid-associated protein YgaU
MTKIIISLNDRKLYFYVNQHLQGIYPISIGKPETPTPIGEFSVIDKTINPGGGLGTRWLGFTRERHGIHGTNNPSTIGKAVSAGCVRMYNHHIEAIYPYIPIGTPIIIKDYYYDSNTLSYDYTNYANKNTYTVRPGDSLWKIAQKYGTTVNDLKITNNLNSDLIFPGQTLIIP